MNKKELTGAVTRLLQEPLEQNGFVLWDIDYIKNREGSQLVIDVDVPDGTSGGLSMEMLTRANEIINELIDDANLIDDAYTLVVQSAGLVRELRTDAHLRRFVGSGIPVNVSLYAPRDGKKQYTGTLAGFDDGTLTLDCDASGGEDAKVIVFERKAIASVKTDLII